MKNLREARNEMGFTQKDIAQMVGISQQSYSDYENGRTFPDEATFIKIADALGVSTDFLLGRSDELGAVVMPVSNPKISRGEQDLLDLYRSIPKELQSAFWNVIKGFAPSGNEVKKGGSRA